MERRFFCTLIMLSIEMMHSLPWDSFNPPPNPFSQRTTDEFAVPRDPFGLEPSFVSSRKSDSPLKPSKNNKLVLPPDGVPIPQQATTKIDASHWPTPPPIGSDNKIAAIKTDEIAPPTSDTIKNSLPVQLPTRKTEDHSASNSRFDKIKENFVLPPPLPSSNPDSVKNQQLLSKKTDVEVTDHLGKDNPLIEHLSKQDRFAKLYERFSRIRRHINRDASSRENPTQSSELLTRLVREVLPSSSFNPGSFLEPNLTPGSWVGRASLPQQQDPLLNNPNVAAVAQQNPGQLQGSSLIASPPDPNGPLVADPIRPSPLVSSWPNVNGRVVLGRGTPVADPGEQKIYLPSQLNDRSSLVLNQRTPLNEGKIFLPQHADVAKQLAAAGKKPPPTLQDPSVQNGGKSWSYDRPNAVLPQQRKIFLPQHKAAAGQIGDMINS